jgi:hypothetical protein
MASVRCHAAIVDGSIVRNALVRYSSGIIPGDTCGVTVHAEEFSVVPMEHEQHSTVDFNGVAVITGSEISFIPISEYLRR